MKTSATQFEMMVNFMEMHGDINKPTKNARGRIGTIQSWETLTNLLNGDPTGESKSTDKWKKVWSDLKNNTKKKAARINRAIVKTGGGPALLAKLCDLEQRVLNIIGPQAATGLHGVLEAGLSQEPTVDPDDDRTITLPSNPPQPACVPVSPIIFTFPIESENIEVADDVWNQPGPSHHPHIPPPSNDGNVTPAAEVDRPNITPAVDNPASRGQTPRRRRDAPPRSLASPRRRRRAETQTEQAARHFLETDREWREFLKKKHEDEMRVRERELETQKRWQEICVYALQTIDKILEHNTKT